MSEAQMGNTKALGRTLSKEHKHKISVGNSKPYPAFVNKITGEIIPAGVNLHVTCREIGLVSACMYDVAKGRQHQHHGWVLAKNL